MVAGWVCRRCGHHFKFGLSMCPLCCSMSVDREEQEMPRNTVAGASLGVQHPDYVEDGPVPPIVPEGIPLDAPIDELVAAVEDAAPTATGESDEPKKAAAPKKAAR